MTDKKVTVAGVSGLVGANLTRALLARGYRVNGTMRNTGDRSKVAFLESLPGAADRLTLYQADMADTGAFQASTEGADCVFIACLVPTYVGASGKPAREMDDAQGYAEIIMPTVDGCLNIMRTAIEYGVRNIVICSSTSSTNPPEPVAYKNETDHWSDEAQQCREKKYTSAAKTVMEKAAIRLAAENEVRLSIMLPTLMLGPAVIPEHGERGFQGMLKSLVNGGAPRHEKMPNGSMSMIHLEDLAELFLAAYENPQASGRYFAVYDSWHWQEIYRELSNLIPGLRLPAPLDEAPQPATTFDFTRRDSLGVRLRDIPTLLRETVTWIRENGS